MALSGCGGRVEIWDPGGNGASVSSGDPGAGPAAAAGAPNGSFPCPDVQRLSEGCWCVGDEMEAITAWCAPPSPPVSRGGCYGAPPARLERLA